MMFPLSMMAWLSASYAEDGPKTATTIRADDPGVVINTVVANQGLTTRLLLSPWEHVGRSPTTLSTPLCLTACDLELEPGVYEFFVNDRRQNQLAPRVMVDVRDKPVQLAVAPGNRRLFYLGRVGRVVGMGLLAFSAVEIRNELRSTSGGEDVYVGGQTVTLGEPDLTVGLSVLGGGVVALGGGIALTRSHRGEWTVQ